MQKWDRLDETFDDDEEELDSPAILDGSVPVKNLETMVEDPAGQNLPRDSLGVKESEKMIDELKKENFNLKLRIFFLEEEFQSSMKGVPSAAFQENQSLRQAVFELEQVRGR
ncbi:hypothetical protein DFJ73DRAFT_874357 [Zopfochytrium polystomum]|nr:hypothetical protein DFJ73DRAFT_874357 [Zopfochytrium polystomum]